MNGLSDALKNAGFAVNEFKEYEKMTEVKLPFGSCTSESEEDAGTELYNDSLCGINFYRKNATEFNLQDYTVNTKDYLYNWLQKNESRCRVLPKSVIHETSNGNLGMHSDLMENDYESSAKYGTSDIVCMFRYSTQYERFEFVCYYTSLNLNIPEQKALRERFKTEMEAARFEADGDKKVFEWCVENLFPECEFIPVVINTFDGCMISHRAYRNRLGYIEEVTSPCLGKNIKRHPKIMEGLKGWLENGGYIRDDKFYLIIKTRESIVNDTDDSYYLRVWKTD